MAENKWHLFGKWIEPVLSSAFWVEFQSKELGFDFFGNIETLDCSYFVAQKDMDKAAEFVADKIDNDRKWFDKLFDICEENIRKVLYYKEHKDISGFLSSLQELFSKSMIIFFLDYGALKYIEKISEKTGVAVGEVLAQIKPFKKTLLMQYHGELKNLDKKDKARFIKKWEWVGTHLFMGSPLTEEKLEKELACAVKNHKERACQKLPDGYEYVLDLGSKLAFYRSYNMEIGDSIMYEYWQDLKALAEKHGLSWDEILLLTYKEIIDLNNKGVLPEVFKDRAKGYGVVLENNRMFVVAGSELQKRLDMCQEKIDKNITELKGMVACRGGVVRGTARVIEEAKYISKMNKGDILVANETTPDYVVGMRIAGAIVTNQGGITSHAAITSREMGIPCIIGTKIATKVLKDGDLVEVDADKGVVRVIKKA